MFIQKYTVYSDIHFQRIIFNEILCCSSALVLFMNSKMLSCEWLMESSRLGRIFQIMKPNHHPDLSSPISKPPPLVPRLHVTNTSRDGDSTNSLNSLFQCLTTLFMKKFFLTSNLNLPWHNLRPFPHVLSFVTLE